MSVRAKFHCEKNEDGQVVLRAVTSGSEENKTWAKYTPAGELRMTVDNPAATGQLVVGQEYYIDITPAKGS